MSLRNVPLEFEYRSGSSNIVDSFYVPCMRESSDYWRSVGYFTSQGLALAAKGLFAFVASGGRMRLVASPLFDAEDVAAIARGYETRTAIAERAILRQLPEPTALAESRFLKDRLSCLAWLVAEGRLEIRIAVPTGDAGVTGIYHEKVGLFFDQDADIVAFSGSANETFGGLAANFESIDVFVSWDDPHARTLSKKRNFERLWSDSTPGLRVIDFPSAAKSKILSYRSRFRPKGDPEQRSASRRPGALTGVRTAKGGEPQMNGSMLLALVEEHLSSVKKTVKGPCLLIYQGFPADFVLEVAKAFAPLNDPKLLYGKKGLRWTSLNDVCKSSIGRVVGNKRSIYVATYEELLRLDGLINLGELVKYPIVIYHNNLFDEYPNQTDRALPMIDETVESGEPGQTKDALFDELYVFSEERIGMQLVQYRDLQNPESTAEHRDFLQCVPAPDEALNYVDRAHVPQDAVMVSSTDDRYFKLKYAVFDKAQLGTRTNFDIVTDMNALKSSAVRAEIGCLKSLYEMNGLALTIWVRRRTLERSYRKDFKDILKKHWQSNSFRTLAFYESPDETTQKYRIEQGALIETVVRQAEEAREGHPFQDVFVTSPTGSGKSLLFQLPAIYLAEKYGLVTIVVSPLKALMYDQVTDLKNRGIRAAAFINSDVTLLERNRIIDEIRRGEVSILYLSPELLLSHDVREFIGERPLGLLVVDEAHLVSTWGKDFRIDYWYLGTYLKRLRSPKYMGGKSAFPILALTATAVYGGPDDTVFETTEALNMVSRELFIGNMRRDEVKFQITPFAFAGSHELAKVARTSSVVGENLRGRVKTIVYCPYIDHIKQIWAQLDRERKRCGIYHGGIPDAFERQRVMDGFKTGDILVVLATKAFGMGIDVSDISQIYHHAPSGTLADYVQEVGRVARSKDVQGIARTDFHPKDLKFTRILWGLSKIKQYQAKYVLQKLNDLYTKHREREMLLSVEDFGFIFGESEPEQVEHKVKSALLLVEKDLYLKANRRYNVVMVRPKALYSIVYACVPKAIEKSFLQKYGGQCELAATVEDNQRRDKRRVDCVVKDVGNVYELQLREMWERYFRQYSFPQVKYLFFKGQLFEEYANAAERVCPRYRLNVTLDTNAGVTLEAMLRSFDKVGEVLRSLGTKTVDSQELTRCLRRGGFKAEASARRVTNLLVSLYAGGWDVTDFGMRPGEGVLLTHASSDAKGERLYKAQYMGFKRERAWLQRKFRSMFEKDHLVSFDKFVSPTGDGQGYLLRMAYLIEAFGLGSYELQGGRLSQIFVRINDPYRLRRAALDPRYSNDLITDVEKKHERSSAQMQEFFQSDMNDKKRWDFIERYFLGKLGD